MYIFAGDIGGTKTNLALYVLKDNALSIQVQHEFSSSEYHSLNEVITAFKNRTPMPDIDAACFGVAGPVIEGCCRTTNLPWDIRISDLQEHLGIQKVRLLNDLEATAYGMLYLCEDEFVDLNPHGRDRDGNRAIIAAGTGLGEAMLYYDGSEYHPIGSEGGHSDFAPLTAQQDALLKWMRDRYPEHVSFERILSGPGIYALYEFLVHSGFSSQSTSLLNIPEGVDRSAMVSECALKEDDPLCKEALRLFVEIYGAEAGNLALKIMSFGGVYIGGGIAPKILPVLANEHFMNGFLTKGRFNEMLQGMQVKVSLNPNTALLGAAHFAVDKL